MGTEEQNEDFQKLHQLIEETDVKGFLEGMTMYAAATLSRGTKARIECAVTLHRRRRRATIAGSSDAAVYLDGVEQSLGSGPCLEALETLQPVLLADTGHDRRWPAYSRSVAAAGTRSVLGVPLELGHDASAALNFFAADTGLFTAETIEDAAVFAEMAGQALRLAVRIATSDLLATDLKAAMQSRTAIDLATGIIMAQDHCSQDEAVGKLREASANRNEKLRDLAQGILSVYANTSHAAAATHFEE